MVGNATDTRKRPRHINRREFAAAQQESMLSADFIGVDPDDVTAGITAGGSQGVPLGQSLHGASMV